MHFRVIAVCHGIFSITQLSDFLKVQLRYVYQAPEPVHIKCGHLFLLSCGTRHVPDHPDSEKVIRSTYYAEGFFQEERHLLVCTRNQDLACKVDTR